MRARSEICAAIAISVLVGVYYGAVIFDESASAQTQTNVRPSQTTQPLNVTVSDCSITIAFTGVPQRLVPANAGRKFLSFQTQPPASGPIPVIGFSYTSTTPIIGVPGTYQLFPGGIAGHESVTIPANSIYVTGPQGTVVSCSQG